MLRIGTCNDISETAFSKPILDLIAGRVVDEVRFCKYRPNLIFPEQFKVEIKVINEQSANGRFKSIANYEFNTNRDGIILGSIEIDSVIRDFILLLGSAFLLLRGRRSPGKWLLGLQIAGQGCAICREVRRIGPLLLSSVCITIFSAWTMTLPAPIPVPSIWFFGLAGFVFLFALVYYVLPLLRWRGAMPYDKATGFEVTRKSQS